MRSPMMPTTTTRSRATNSCVGGHCAATPTDGGWGWVCCNTGASPVVARAERVHAGAISARPPNAVRGPRGRRRAGRVAHIDGAYCRGGGGERA